MASPRGRQGSEPTTPAQAGAVSPPPSFHQPGHDFTLQAVMDMQKTLAALSVSVDHLITSESKTCEKVARVEKVMYAAGVVLVISLAIGGWLVSTAKEIAMKYVDASITQQHQEQAANSKLSTK